MHLGLGNIAPLPGYSPLKPGKGFAGLGSGSSSPGGSYTTTAATSSSSTRSNTQDRVDQSTQPQSHGGVSPEVVDAVQQGRVQEVEELLRRKRTAGTEPEHPRVSQLTDKDGCTLLHWAAANNRTAIARLLLDDGAEVDAVGGELGETPLMWACRSGERKWGHTHMVALLLGAGADVNKQSYHGNNALFVAVQCRSVQIVMQLLAARAGPGGALDVNGTNPQTGDTALLSLLKNFEDRYYDGKPKELVRLLLAWGSDVHQADCDGNTLLHLLARAPPEDMDIGVMFTIAELARRTAPRAFDSSSAAAKEHARLLDRRNLDGQTPAQVAQTNERAGASIIKFLEQYWLYCNAPEALPMVNMCVLTLLLPVLLQHFHYVGFLVWGPFCAAALWTDQTKVPVQKSKSAYGFAWGNIIGIWYGFHLHSAPFVPGWLSWVIGALVIFVLSTLYATRISQPASLPRGQPGDVEVKMLADKLVAHGNPDGMDSRFKATTTSSSSSSSSSSSPSSHPRPHPSDSSPRLCATCLTDRSMASTHCSECNCCRQALDHHCPFVNNCVGRGNRRVFVMFCGSACLASSLISMIGLMVQYSGNYCLDTPFSIGTKWDMFAWPFSIQWCIIQDHPAFALIVYIGFISAGWVGGLCFNQLDMVANETTTYEQIREMKQRYDTPFGITALGGGIPGAGGDSSSQAGSGHTAAHARSSSRSWRLQMSNVWRFLKTGNFTITRRGQGAAAGAHCRGPAAETEP